MRNDKPVFLRHVAPPLILSCSYYGAQWCTIYVLQICNTKVSQGRRDYGQAAFYLLFHRAPQSAGRAGGRDLAAGARLPRTAAGGGGALLRRGRRAGFRHAGGGKTAGVAEEPTLDTHRPGAALSRLPKPLDTRAAGPCGGGGGEGRQGGHLLPKTQP